MVDSYNPLEWCSHARVRNLSFQNVLHHTPHNSVRVGDRKSADRLRSQLLPPLAAMDFALNRQGRSDCATTAANAVADLLATMGFPEALITQAMRMASQSPDRAPNIDGIIEILVNMTTPAAADPSSTKQKRRQHLLFDSHSANSSGSALAVSGGSAPRLPAHRGGGAAAAASAALNPDATSGQIEVISGTVKKQRHIWGFRIQSEEQVEVSFMMSRRDGSSELTLVQVHVVIHEGNAKLRYFDLQTGVLRRTLPLQGCIIERGTNGLLGVSANCTLKVTLAQTRPLSDITLLFDDDTTAMQWQNAIQFAVSNTIPEPTSQLSIAPAAASLLQCLVCFDEIASPSDAIRCPNGQHCIHKGECFERCVASQVSDARKDPGLFNSRGNHICCLACPLNKKNAWNDSDIKRFAKSSTWQASACACSLKRKKN